jgi:hypothetical protein
MFNTGKELHGFDSLYVNLSTELIRLTTTPKQEGDK